MNEYEMYIELGRRVRSERLRRGLTRTEPARRIRMTRSNPANCESGRLRFTIRRLLQVAAALSMSPCLFFATEFEHVAQRAEPHAPKPRGGAALKARVMELERLLAEREPSR